MIPATTENSNPNNITGNSMEIIKGNPDSLAIGPTSDQLSQPGLAAGEPCFF